MTCLLAPLTVTYSLPPPVSASASVVVGGIVGAGDVVNVGLHPFPGGFVDGLAARVFSDGLVTILAELLVVEECAVLLLGGTGVADQNETVTDEPFAAQFIDGGDEFELGQIAAGAENDDCAGNGSRHGRVA